MKKMFLLVLLLFSFTAEARYDVYPTNYDVLDALLRLTPIPIENASSASSTNALSSAASTAYATNLVVKASSGRLCMLIGYNSKASAQFIQIYNSATLPADTAVPIYTFTVPATSNFSLDFGPYCRYFATGIVIGNSSTGPTKTIGSADVWFNAEYK